MNCDKISHQINNKLTELKADRNVSFLFNELNNLYLVFLYLSSFISSKKWLTMTLTHRNIQLFNLNLKFMRKADTLADDCVSMHMTRLTYIFFSFHSYCICLFVSVWKSMEKVQLNGYECGTFSQIK